VVLLDIVDIRALLLVICWWYCDDGIVIIVMNIVVVVVDVIVGIVIDLLFIYLTLLTEAVLFVVSITVPIWRPYCYCAGWSSIDACYLLLMYSLLFLIWRWSGTLWHLHFIVSVAFLADICYCDGILLIWWLEGSDNIVDVLLVTLPVVAEGLLLGVDYSC